MTKFTERNLNQYCVYWGSPVNDGSGAYTYANPVELRCYWKDTAITDLAELGIATNVRSQVYLSSDVEEQGMLLNSKLADVAQGDLDDPVNAGASIIVRFDKIPSIKGDCFKRVAYIGRR